VQVKDVVARRGRGWRPRGQVCEGCRGRAWGPGAGAAVWEAWERREGGRVAKRAEESAGERRGSAKGKGKSLSLSGEEEGGEDEEDGGGAAAKGPLVVFACRHLWHKMCVETGGGGGGGGGGAQRLTCPLCI
jgi:hypothetical protein